MISSNDKKQKKPLPKNIEIVIRNTQGEPDYHTQVPLTSSVLQLKTHLSQNYPYKLGTKHQPRLIFAGKYLEDDQTLDKVFENTDVTQPQIVHLIPRSSTNSTSSIQQKPQPTTPQTPQQTLPQQQFQQQIPMSPISSPISPYSPFLIPPFAVPPNFWSFYAPPNLGTQQPSFQSPTTPVTPTPFPYMTPQMQQQYIFQQMGQRMQGQPQTPTTPLTTSSTRSAGQNVPTPPRAAQTPERPHIRIAQQQNVQQQNQPGIVIWTPAVKEFFVNVLKMAVLAFLFTSNQGSRKWFQMTMLFVTIYLIFKIFVVRSRPRRRNDQQPREQPREQAQDQQAGANQQQELNQQVGENQELRRRHVQQPNMNNEQVNVQRQTNQPQQQHSRGIIETIVHVIYLFFVSLSPTWQPERNREHVE